MIICVFFILPMGDHNLTLIAAAVNESNASWQECSLLVFKCCQSNGQLSVELGKHSTVIGERVFRCEWVRESSILVLSF